MGCPQNYHTHLSGPQREMTLYHLCTSLNQGVSSIMLHCKVSDTRGPFYKKTYGSIIQISNITKIPDDLAWKLKMSSGHNFPHVTTAQKSWRVQIFDMISSLQSKWEQNDVDKIWMMRLYSVCRMGHNVNLHANLLIIKYMRPHPIARVGI